MPTEIELAYAAGFFDGEGCVRIQVEKNRKGVKKVQTSLAIAVSNVDPRPINKFAELFCGYKRKKVQVNKWINANYRVQYEWRTRGFAAYEFCKAIYPFSILKKEQLEIAIQFYELPWRSHRKSRGGGWKIRTEENVITDLKFANRIKELKYAS